MVDTAKSEYYGIIAQEHFPIMVHTFIYVCPILSPYAIVVLTLYYYWFTHPTPISPQAPPGGLPQSNMSVIYVYLSIHVSVSHMYQ